MMLYARWAPLFHFTAEAKTCYQGGGTVSVTPSSQTVQGGEGETVGSCTITFEAEVGNATFHGWYTDEGHTQKVSGDPVYHHVATNSEVGTNLSVVLYAWFKKNQTLSWKNDLTDFNLVRGTTADCAAVATSGLTPKYNSSNAGVASVDDYGVVTGNSVSNDGVLITASQPGNDEFNAAPEITRTFYVLEKLQASYVVSGFEGNNPTILVGAMPTVSVSNVDGDFTYTSSDNAVVSLSRDGNVITMTALKAGTSTITLKQEANATHNAASAVYNITVERHHGGLAVMLPETMKVGDSCTDFWTTTNTDVSVSVESSNTGVIKYEGGKLIATGEGTAVITVSQAETVKWAGESTQKTIKVSKVANTLGVSLPAQEVKVGESIPVTFSNQNDTVTSVLGNITEQTLSSLVNDGVEVIAYVDGAIVAKNAGTAKITFTQAPSTMYEGYTSTTYTITVSKHSNPISVSLNGGSATTLRLKYGEKATLSYVSENSTSDFSVNRTSGSFTTLTGTTIVAGNEAGTDLYEVTQVETYKYEAGYSTFSIRVNNTDEEEMYIVNDNTSYDGWTLSTLASYSFDGHPGDIVKFEAKRASGGSNSGFYLDYSTDNGSSWNQKWYFISTDTEWNSYSVTLPEGVTKIRFELYTGSTLNKSVRNVKVTRKTYLEAVSDVTDFGTVYIGDSLTATFTVDYSTTNGGNVMINSSNDNFVLSETELATATNTDGTKTFTVTYAPNPLQLGSESALITISDLFYNQQITLTATAAKLDNTLHVVGEQNLKVGEYVDNVCSDMNSDAQLIVTTSKEGIVTYDAVANRLTAIGEGTVTLTFSQNANDYYLAASKNVTVNVSKNDNTLSMTLGKSDLKVEESTQVQFSNKNSSGLITASFTVDGVLSYEDGVITALKSGSTRITLTQVATVSHVGASQSFDVTVSKHDQTIQWDNVLSGAYLTLSVGATLSTNTATASTGLPVTYSSSNTSVLTVDANTGLLTAVSGGANITVTATQAGNYKYNEVSISRSFTVISKMNATVATSLSEEEDNVLVVGENNATISSTALLTTENFILSGADGVVSTSLVNNILTITPLKSGTVTIRLYREEDNSYYSIDKSYSITVQGPVVTISPNEVPDFEYTEYRRLTLDKTLKAGFSTLALPFATTVSKMVGAGYDEQEDWVAQLSVVTYNAEDGYTLYFQKKTDGIISANEPYILHLAAAVAQPTFSDVVVETPTPVEVNATGGVDNAMASYREWKMVSNYEPGMSMAGNYGITADRLMLGGASSTLAAYSAYIVPPTSGPAPVRVAVTDDSGNVTLIEGLELGEAVPSTVYNISGARTSRMHTGINIVVHSNGMARKVLK